MTEEITAYLSHPASWLGVLWVVLSFCFFIRGAFVSEPEQSRSRPWLERNWVGIDGSGGGWRISAKASLYIQGGVLLGFGILLLEIVNSGGR